MTEIRTLGLGLLVVIFAVVLWTLAQGIGESVGSGIVERLVP